MDNKEKSIRDIYLEINTQCNISCPYCYNKENLFYKKEINLDSLESIIEYISKVDCKRVIISGGEPLLNKNFKEIIELLYISNVRGIINIEIQLISNLYLLDKSLYEFLKSKNVLIGCSLDTYSSSDKSLLRLLRKDFVDKNFFSEIYVIVCVYGQSIIELKKLFKKLLDLNVLYVNVSFVANMIKDEEYLKEVFRLLLKYNNKFMKVNSEILTSVTNNILFKPQKYCDANKIVKIDTELKVYPCYLSGKSLSYGKIVDGQLCMDIHKHEAINNKIYKSNHNLCNKCEYNNFCKGCCFFLQENSDICIMKTGYEMVVGQNERN